MTFNVVVTYNMSWNLFANNLTICKKTGSEKKDVLGEAEKIKVCP